MPRRKGDEAKERAQKGLDVRLELLIRNDKFKHDLENGRIVLAMPYILGTKKKTRSGIRWIPI